MKKKTNSVAPERKSTIPWCKIVEMVTEVARASRVIVPLLLGVAPAFSQDDLAAPPPEWNQAAEVRQVDDIADTAEVEETDDDLVCR